MYHRLLHLHNIIFLLAARGSQERRTTACSIEWGQLSYILSQKKLNLQVNGKPLVSYVTSLGCGTQGKFGKKCAAKPSRPDTV